MSFRTRIDNKIDHLKNSRVSKIPRYENLSTVGSEPGMVGDIILDRSTKLFCYHNENEWVCFGQIGGIGPQGPQGIPGVTGAQGPTGDNGAVGAQGPQGADGEVGEVGATGADGADGATGAQGPPGVTGPDGGLGDQFTETTGMCDARTWTAITPTVGGTGDIVLDQQGTVGALMRTVEDGTVPGGNCRGDYAVDLQITRNDAADVAVGTGSVIINGANNKLVTGSDYSGVINGNFNDISGYADMIISGNNGDIVNSVADNGYNIIHGGVQNRIGNTVIPQEALYNSILGGNLNAINTGSNTSQYNIIVNGDRNSAFGLAATPSTIYSGNSGAVSSKGLIYSGDDNSAIGSSTVYSGSSHTVAPSINTVITGTDNDIQGGTHNYIGTGNQNLIGISQGDSNNTAIVTGNNVNVGGNKDNSIFAGQNIAVSAVVGSGNGDAAFGGSGITASLIDTRIVGGENINVFLGNSLSIGGSNNSTTVGQGLGQNLLLGGRDAVIADSSEWGRSSTGIGLGVAMMSIVHAGQQITKNSNPVTIPVDVGNDSAGLDFDGCVWSMELRTIAIDSNGNYAMENTHIQADPALATTPVVLSNTNNGGGFSISSVTWPSGTNEPRVTIVGLNGIQVAIFITIYATRITIALPP